jgi:diguanylate cyclase (GGDEF)-like protein/PAS domain S-box-containing protein
MTSDPFGNGQSGPPGAGTTGPDDMEALIQFQGAILEDVALGYDDPEMVDRICRFGERLVPGSVATVMLLDDTGALNLHAAPSASRSLADYLDGLRPGPEAGSCGNAIYRQEPVFVADTLTDPRWRGLRHMAQACGVQSCWSIPIYARDSKVIGTFALSGFEQRMPSVFQQRLMEIAASLIGIVLARRKQTDALKRSEERFRRLFETGTDSKFLLSREGRILDLNHIAYQRLGYTKNEMLGRYAAEFVAPEHAAEVARRIARVSREGQATYTSAQVCKDGSVIEVEISTIRLELDGQETYYSIVRDVTERSRIEKALHESEKRFRDLVETTTDWIWETDAALRYVYVSPGARAILGYAPEALLGKTPFDLMPPDEVRAKDALVRVIVESRAPLDQVESRRIHRYGHEVIVETSGLPLFDAEGRLTGYRGVTRDITRRKEMERELRENEAHLRGIVEHAPIGLATVSLEGRFLEVNRSLCEIVGYEKAELERMTFQQVTHPDDLAPDLDNAKRLLAGEIPFYKMEKRYIRKDGRVVWVQLTGSLLRDAVGAPLHFVAQVEDISDRKAAEQRLRQALELADGVIHAIPDLLFEVDQHGTYVNIWAQTPELLAAPKAALLGRTLDEVLPADSAAVAAASLREADEKRRSFGMVMPLPLPQGMKWFELSVAKKDGVAEPDKRFIVLSRDITERVKTQEQLRQLAYYDTLTELPNRRFLLEKLDWALTQAKRYRRSLAVMFLDLDRFKQVNDRLGHDFGDRLLKAVAARLNETVRHGDIVSRPGGDEFIIVLTEISQPADAVLVAAKIIEALATPVEIGPHQIEIGTSIGIAIYPVDGMDDARELMKKADSAMYMAKQSGGNRYHLAGS